MADKTVLSKDEVDFLKEMVNIGVGNAVTALSQLLHYPVDLKVPAVYSLTLTTVSSILDEPALPVVCVKMDMVGSVNGEVFFIVSEKDKDVLVRAAEKAMFGAVKKGALDLSVLEEIGNIMAGVYLTAIHDFCKLNIYHTVPSLRTDMLQSLLDELLINMGRQAESFIVVESEFTIAIESEIAVQGEKIRTFLLMIPSVESVKKLVDSVKGAMPR
jgi:chemotaxis protein CheC